MKKIIMSLVVIVIFFGNFNSFVYAANETEEDDGSWVSDAFSAAYEFLNEGVTSDDTVIGDTIDSLLDFFTNIVQGINIVLLTALAGISMIALSIVGVRYIASGADPMQRKIAVDSLHTVFKGMLYGFGAFVIWNIAMAIVRIIIGALAQT